MTKYLIDTNLYIRAIRDIEAGKALREFSLQFAPHLYISSVVLQELSMGATSVRKLAQVEADVVRPFERRGRIVTPSHEAWKQTGRVLASLKREEAVEVARLPKSFVNDVLLGCSCREAGVTLITENRGDFERIEKRVRFGFVAPWPRG